MKTDDKKQRTANRTYPKGGVFLLKRGWLCSNDSIEASGPPPTQSAKTLPPILNTEHALTSRIRKVTKSNDVAIFSI
jgi:hypothetical protein